MKKEREAGDLKKDSSQQNKTFLIDYGAAGALSPELELKELLESSVGETVVKMLQDPLLKDKCPKYKLAMIRANLLYFLKR